MKVKVRWTEKIFHEAILEVDDIDDLEQAIGDFGGPSEVASRFEGVDEYEVLDERNVVLPDVKVRQYEPDWED